MQEDPFDSKSYLKISSSKSSFIFKNPTMRNLPLKRLFVNSLDSEEFVKLTHELGNEFTLNVSYLVYTRMP